MLFTMQQACDGWLNMGEASQQLSHSYLGMSSVSLGDIFAPYAACLMTSDTNSATAVDEAMLAASASSDSTRPDTCSNSQLN